MLWVAEQPDFDGEALPFSVSCSSAADCWEVQVFGSPLLEHWNGAAWSMASAAALGQPFNPELSGVNVFGSNRRRRPARWWVPLAVW
jgi:hypothetical protein